MPLARQRPVHPWAAGRIVVVTWSPSHRTVWATAVNGGLAIDWHLDLLVIAIVYTPNILAPLSVLTSLNFAFAVLAEASLAFLGLGNKSPAPSWGSMVSASYGFIQLAPWAPIFPGTAIALTVLGLNLLGDGIRDALDPRMRS